jgi:hypothetical protein
MPTPPAEPVRTTRSASRLCGDGGTAGGGGQKHHEKEPTAKATARPLPLPLEHLFAHTLLSPCPPSWRKLSCFPSSLPQSVSVFLLFSTAQQPLGCAALTGAHVRLSRSHAAPDTNRAPAAPAPPPPGLLAPPAATPRARLAALARVHPAQRRERRLRRLHAQRAPRAAGEAREQRAQRAPRAARRPAERSIHRLEQRRPRGRAGVQACLGTCPREQHPVGAKRRLQYPGRKAERAPRGGCVSAAFSRRRAGEPRGRLARAGAHRAAKAASTRARSRALPPRTFTTT